MRREGLVRFVVLAVLLALCGGPGSVLAADFPLPAKVHRVRQIAKEGFAAKSAMLVSRPEAKGIFTLPDADPTEVGGALRYVVPVGPGRLRASLQIDRVDDLGKAAIDSRAIRAVYPLEDSDRLVLSSLKVSVTIVFLLIPPDSRR